MPVDRTPEESDGGSRGAATIQMLGAAIGLGPYIVVAGAVAEWARMAGAGLPASRGLASIEPVTLLASGFQTLLIAVVLLVVIHVAVDVERDLRLSPRLPAAVTWAKRGAQIVSQVVIATLVAYAALLPTTLVVGLLALTSGVTGLAVAVAAVAVVCVAWSCTTWVLVPAGRRPLTRPGSLTGLSALRAQRPDIVAAVPPVLRGAVEHATRLGGVGVLVVTLPALCAVAVLAIGVLGRRSDLGALEILVPSAGVYVGAFAALWIVFSLIVGACAGVVMLRAAASRASAVPLDEAAQKARSSLATLASIIVALFVLPQWLGFFAVTLMLMVLLVDRLPDTLSARSLAVALVFALGFMAFQARAPQRFDRLDLTVPGSTGKRPLALRVAIVGDQGDAYVIAACDRVHSEVRGRLGWTS